MDDQEFLDKTVQLAIANAGAGGAPFASIVVRGSRVVGTGQNQSLTAGDPTGHAEIVAIRDAARGTQSRHLTNCVLYSSAEPCPMCLGAAYWAQVSRIVYCTPTDELTQFGYRDGEIYEEIRRAREARTIPSVRRESSLAPEMVRLYASLKQSSKD